MTYTHKNKGTCSDTTTVTVEDGVVSAVSFTNGCEGNLTGLSVMCVGRPADEVIDKLRGTRCGRKATSCPDQLALTLLEARDLEAKQQTCAAAKTATP